MFYLKWLKYKKHLNNNGSNGLRKRLKVRKCLWGIYKERRSPFMRSKADAKAGIESSYIKFISALRASFEATVKL